MENESTQKTAVIIFNPLAGRGKASTYARKSQDLLTRADWRVSDVIASEYAGHIETVLAKRYGSNSTLIVIIGGDGTLRELVTGLRNAQLKPEVVFIPMGNANVVARELNIPLDPAQALSLLNSKTTKQVDIGIVRQTQQDDLIFLAMLEIGFGAKIVSLADHLRNGTLKTLYRYWGDLVYGIAGLLALRGLKHKTFNAQIEGVEKIMTSTHCVIANMQTYAKGWSLTPDAKFDDGLLDTAISQNSSAWATLYTFLAASRKRKLKPALMDYQRTKQVTISSQSALFVQVDGDPIHFKGYASITVEEAAFSIRVSEPDTPC